MGPLNYFLVRLPGEVADAEKSNVVSEAAITIDDSGRLPTTVEQTGAELTDKQQTSESSAGI